MTPVVEVGWAVGADASLGPSRTIAGVGGGPSVGVGVGERWTVEAEARWLLFAGSAGVVRAGANWTPGKGAWRPSFGPEATVFVGEGIRTFTSGDAAISSGPLLAVQARVQPIRFEGADWSVSLLRLDVGAGWEKGGVAPAVGVTVVEVGVGL